MQLYLNAFPGCFAVIIFYWRRICRKENWTEKHTTLLQCLFPYMFQLQLNLKRILKSKQIHLPRQFKVVKLFSIQPEQVEGIFVHEKPVQSSTEGNTVLP